MSQAASDTTTLDLETEEEGMTKAQAFIIDKFATIQAELESLVRQTKQTRKHIKRK